MFCQTVALSLLGLLCISVIVRSEIEDRIVNGQDTTIAAHPYQVSLQMDGRHICGGSLYSHSIIVTAAHCVKPMLAASLSSLKVRLGSKFRNSGGVLDGVADMKIHPKYNPTTMIYDVGLIKLKSPVAFSERIQRIGLAERTVVNGTRTVVTGWGTLSSGAAGLPLTLQAVTVAIISKKYCSSNHYAYSTAIKSTMICAGLSGKDSCQGDSGGPLISKKTGRLVGIVSWGIGCAERKYPGVYTNVALMRPWIIDNAAKM